MTLLADVATNYVQYRVAQQRIKIARDNIRSQEKLVGGGEEPIQEHPVPEAALPAKKPEELPAPKREE